MCTTKVSPALATMSLLASINMPELSMATCPRGSLSTAKISPADAATARCTSSRSGMRRLLHPGWQVQRLHPAAPAIASSMAQAPHCLTWHDVGQKRHPRSSFPLYHRADNEVGGVAQTDDAESIAGR